MSQDKPKRKISTALQPPNISDPSGHGLATISETQSLRKTSQEQGPAGKPTSEYVGLRRVSQEQQDANRRKDSRKISAFSMIGRKTSFMSVPEKLLKDKVRI